MTNQARAICSSKRHQALRKTVRRQRLAKLELLTELDRIHESERREVMLLLTVKALGIFVNDKRVMLRIEKILNA